MRINQACLLDGMADWIGIEADSRVIFTPLASGFLVWDLKTEKEYTFSKLAAAPKEEDRFLTDDIRSVISASDDELRERAQQTHIWSGLYELIQSELKYREAVLQKGCAP